ncbi:DUF4065 domain-containing protein [Glutamicibacter halophytocola]|uniref:DUF4065 domain-containing protein n=1 Tax=Glutamicibacter halophytocola TaxID=1933880 RepID=A0ABX5Y5C6_9MICC|nr:type II toxin-antitoxin system antitoxin SocA domain-containing protein [Glutamicibacter halophytocola]QDY64890.1 DUF4065 domain-containing protein [Glutamicibacter halophytocola]
MHGTRQANDLAAYLILKLGRIETLKLQKLLYYCNGWSMALRDKPIFRDRTEAWMHGPVVVDIYQSHRLKSSVDEWKDGNPDRLDKQEKAIAEMVISLYGKRSGWALRNLTHNESPWAVAWERCGQGARRNEEITRGEIDDYFSGLLASGQVIDED